MPKRSRRRAPRSLPSGTLGVLRRALAEDRVRRDRTTQRLFPRPTPATAEVVVQSRGVLSGVSASATLARMVGLRVTESHRDGETVRAGQSVLRLQGDARRMLGVERTMLNLLMHLSGVATATRRAVDATVGSVPRLKVFATRKTLPGLRDLEKSAVVHGGGEAHRRDLASAVLVKNNHLVFFSPENAVRRLKTVRGRRGSVQVEVRSAAEALGAARAGADALLIDNATPARARSIVRTLERAGVRRRVWVELSGGLTAENVGRYRRVGADAVSLGAITHSAPALPFHLRIRGTGRHRGKARRVKSEHPLV